MRNITVSVPDDLYKKARVKAAEQDTTISAVVRKGIEAYVEPAPKRHTRLFELLDEFHRERANGPHFRASERMTREEVHDRDALRRLEHPVVPSR